jgi:hypothetical protein
MGEPREGFFFPFRRSKYIGALIVAALFAFLAWPTATVQCPTWGVQVVDDSGHPLQGMTVRLSYKNYSGESESHHEDLQTDAKGYVLFHQKSLRAPGVRRALAIVGSATGGVHASFGPHAWVWTFGKGLEGIAVNDGHVTDWTGSPSQMTSKIVAKPGTSVIRTY